MSFYIINKNRNLRLWVQIKWRRADRGSWIGVRLSSPVPNDESSNPAWDGWTLISLRSHGNKPDLPSLVRFRCRTTPVHQIWRVGVTRKKSTNYYKRQNLQSETIKVILYIIQFLNISDLFLISYKKKKNKI